MLVPGATFSFAPVHCLIPALPQEGIAEEQVQGPEAGWGPGEARDLLARLLSPAAPLCLLLRLEGSSTAPGGSRCTSSTTAVHPGPINTDAGNIEINIDAHTPALHVRVDQAKPPAARQGRGGTRIRQGGSARLSRALGKLPAGPCTSGHVEILFLVLYTLQAAAVLPPSMTVVRSMRPCRL